MIVICHLNMLNYDLQCMDGKKADLFISEIAGLMPNAPEYAIYWLAKVYFNLTLILIDKLSQ